MAPLSPETITKIQALMARAGLTEADLEEQFILGSGSGGQKINKTASAVRLIHKPTGKTVKCQATRSRENNRWMARRELATQMIETMEGEQSARQQEAEKTRRQKRRRSRRQKNRMLDDKARHAQKKAGRRFTSDE